MVLGESGFHLDHYAMRWHGREETMWYVIGGIIAVVLVFIGWRWASVGRGARQRDERILKLIDPIGHKLESRESITPEEILQVARHPETRFMLIGALR
jgi:hypothetical protein